MYKFIRPFSVIIASVTLFACSMEAEDPKKVADRYWQYLQNGNTVEAERLVSLNSRYTFSEKNDFPPSIKQLNNGEAITTVRTTITTVDPDSKESYTQSFDTVLVLEQGQWKIDVNRTQLPLTQAEKEEQLQKLTRELSDSVQQNIETLDEAMTEGIEMLNDTFHEGSREMSDSLLRLMNDLNSSMRDSIDRMKQRRQQELEEQQQQEIQKNQDNGEGMI